jgi:hypothetical protein
MAGVVPFAEWFACPVGGAGLKISTAKNSLSFNFGDSIVTWFPNLKSENQFRL